MSITEKIGQKSGKSRAQEHTKITIKFLTGTSKGNLDTSEQEIIIECLLGEIKQIQTGLYTDRYLELMRTIKLTMNEIEFNQFVEKFVD